MARLDVSVRATRQPHWPDRAAHLRRRRARKVFWVVAVLLLVLPWLGYRSVRDWIGPGAAEPPAAPIASGPKAPAPAAPLRASTPVAGPRLPAQAAATAATADVDPNPDQGQGDALLADRGSAVRREAGRREVETIAGVRAAGWVDRMSMVVVVSGGGTNAYQTIAEACRRLGLHGDVTGVAISVQEVAAGGRRPPASLSAECAANAAGDAALQVAGGRLLPGRAVRPGSSAADAAELEQRRIRQVESLRILSESTPELADPH